MNKIMPLLAILTVLFMSGCSASKVAGALLGGGGPNVAANVQAGQNNAQTVGKTNINNQKLIRPQARTIEQSTGDKKVQSEKVETIIIQEKDSPWLIIALALAVAVGIIGWMLPTPGDMLRKRKKNNGA